MWDKTLKELHENLERKANDESNAKSDDEEKSTSWLRSTFDAKSLRQVLLVLVVGIVCANLLVFAYVLLMYFFGLSNDRHREAATTSTEERDTSRRTIRSSVVQAVGVTCLLTNIPPLAAILILGRTLSRKAIAS